MTLLQVTMISKFRKVAEFTAGSPMIVDITSQVVHSCFGNKEEPIQALAESLSLENTPSVSEKNYVIPVY